MSQSVDIDPQLRDAVQSSQICQADALHANTSSTPSRHSPPTSKLPQADAPQYAPYPQKHDGPYHHDFYGRSSDQQYDQNEPSLDYQQLPTTSGMQQSVKERGKVKRLRACEACRSLKVRCEPDPNHGPCKRCLRSGRECEVTLPSRKRQKKTDSRVSELEKQLAEIQTQLKINSQMASIGEAARHRNRSSSLIDSPDRGSENQPRKYAPHNEQSKVESDTQGLLQDRQNCVQKRPPTDIDQTKSLEASFIQSAQQPHQNSAITTSSLSQEVVLKDIRIIASSVDSDLAVTLMCGYVEILLAHKSKLGALLIDEVKVLQRAKPVLFIAIVMCMLQKWCKNTAQSSDATTSQEGNHALHLLSGVAMGNGAKIEGKETEETGGVTVANKFESRQYLANTFAEKLLGVDDSEVRSGTWFEELIQEFH